PPGGERLVEGGRELRLAGHVAAGPDRLPAAIREGGGRRLGGRFVEVGDAAPRALTGKVLGDLQADAACGAGHESDAILQCPGHVSSPGSSPRTSASPAQGSPTLAVRVKRHARRRVPRRFLHFKRGVEPGTCRRAGPDVAKLHGRSWRVSMSSATSLMTLLARIL